MALNKGRTLPLLQLALDLRHNRKTRRNVGHVRGAFSSSRVPRWLLVLQKQAFSLYNIVRVLTYPRAERATGASYRGTMTQSTRLDVLSTVFFFFTKAGRNFAQVQVFLGIHGSFLHFCQAGLNFAQRSH